MRYLSVCSGIEAVSTAWEPLGFSPVAFCEFDRFPSAVLAHHWPHVPNLGDMTKWRDWPDEILNDADILAGGTPCQAFSIAGLRNSLADERGNLTLTYVHILDQIDETRARNGRPPALCLWENVPGVLNTDDNAFGCFLAALAGEEFPLEPPGGRWTDAGYVRGPRRAIAWRSLDAQYFGLAQRRQRVFVVASASEGFRPEEILFEFEGVRRDSPPSRGKGEGASHDVIGCLTSSGRGVERTGDTRGQDPVIAEIHCMATGQAGAEIGIGIGIGTTLSCNHEAPIVTQEVAFKASHFTRGKDGAPQTIAPPLSADADKGDQDTLVCVNTGQGFWKEQPHAGTLGVSPRDAHENNLVCVHGTQDPCTDENLAFALGRNSGQENVVMFQGRGSNIDLGQDVSGTLGQNCDRASGGAPCIAFSCKDHGADAGEISPTLRSMNHDGSHANGGGQVAIAFDTTQITSPTNRSNPQEGDPCHPLAAGAHAPAIAFQERGRAMGPNLEIGGDLAFALTAPNGGGRSQERNVLTPTMAVRRLMPVECARLQGFPDDHTDIMPKGKPTPDGPQYKAYGNSMAVPVIAWIGRRISTKHSV